MVMTEKGKIIRMPCKDIRAISRNTQGVRLVRLEEGDKIGSVEPIVDEEPAALEEKK
jgi:DNA gyrase subunit A